MKLEEREDRKLLTRREDSALDRPLNRRKTVNPREANPNHGSRTLRKNLKTLLIELFKKKPTGKLKEKLLLMKTKIEEISDHIISP